MKAAITRKLPGQQESRLKSYFDEVLFADRDKTLTPQELAQLASSAEVLICTVVDKIDGALLERCANLKHVITYSVGVDHVDVEALKAKGVRLSFMPDVLTDATADMTLALLLSSARRLKPAMHFVEEGKFQGCEPGIFLGHPTKDSVLGIVGMGRIGMAVAKRALAFQMKILYTSRSPKTLPFPAMAVTLGDLLQRSDFVSLHCPLTPETKKLLGRKELAIMKERAVLVNTARGALVDEKALTAHLRTHPEFFAGIDVYESEPHVTPGLAALPNAFCLPHIGSATWTARQQMAEICIEEAIRFFRGETLKYEYKT